jgi:hypothetical protein
MTDRESIPYYENQYHEKLKFFGDAAGLLLDTYGTPAKGNNGQPIDSAAWSDVEIATNYELARFHHQAAVDGRLLHQIDLKITETYPNGEKSIKTHSINPFTMTKSTWIQQMTAAERAELEERVRISEAQTPDLPKDQLRILPPRRDDLQPEYEMELLLQVLNRGLEILEQ